MAKYIERESFIAEHRHLYCDNCERRKGMKNGKMKFVYAIGEVPCRACGIGDMLDSIEDYPAADVVARDCFNKILAENDDMRAIIDTYGGLENIQSAFVKLHEIETADVVPVVRCRDCVYWRGENDICKGICIDFSADGYCSDGKRKDGDGE